jgi:hypothetical protein
MFDQTKNSLEECRKMFTTYPIMQRKFRFNEFLIGKKKPIFILNSANKRVFNLKNIGNIW